MTEDKRMALEALGWERASNDEPGIFVRSNDAVQRSTIDWMEEPLDLPPEVKMQLEELKKEQHERG